MSSNKKINLLWLVDHLGYSGFIHGAGKYYLNTLPFMDSTSFNTFLYVLRSRDNLTRQFEDKGINIHHLGRSKLDPFTLLDIIKVVKKENIQLIHCHGYGSANFGRLVKLFTNVRVVIHAHDDDRNYPWHQNISDLLLKNFNDKAIAVSEGVKESSIKKRRIPSERISVMHNGIPLEEFKTFTLDEISKEKKNMGINFNAKVIGTIAKLREEKGTEFFIKSAPNIIKEFPDTVFLIVGDGPLRTKLEELSKSLSIDEKVIFAGFRENIPIILSLIDIVVIPSLTEGSPLALLEAMAMSKPIVATNVGGMQEILKDNENGLFVPPQDPGALSDKISFLLKNEDEAKSLGARAKEDSSKYDIRLHVKKLDGIYKELLLI